MPKKQSKKKKRRYNPNKRKAAPQQKPSGVSLKARITELNRLKPIVQAAKAARQRAREKEGAAANGET